MKIAITFCALLLCGGITVMAAEKGEKKPAAAGEKKPVDMEAVFKRKDANADGKLSKDEFLKGSKDAAKSETQFTAKDKDKDGSLSKEEFLAAPKKKKATS